MGLHYENLDQKTRQFMLQEVDRDVKRGELYLSARFNESGEQVYEQLLREAIQDQDDTWLADEISHRGLMKAFHGVTKTGKPRKVPSNAQVTFAEGEFNRFYARGLCLRAANEGIDEIEVYRGRHSSAPRPESEAMIGHKFRAESLLNDLRTSQGVEPALGLPPGPNSGLTIRLS